MGKNDVFSQHGNCNTGCGNSPFLRVDNLLSEFSSMTQTERMIALQNLGIKNVDKFSDLKGLAISNPILSKSFDDNKVVVKCVDGTINIVTNNELQSSGIIKTTYYLSVTNSGEGNGGSHGSDIKLQQGENIVITKSGDTYTISAKSDIVSGEDPNNKVNIIDKNSDHIHYPSALAVYNFLVESLKDIETDIKYAKTEDVANDVDSILYGD